jgi:selenocysteine lyase/cysteine desulfurase
MARLRERHRIVVNVKDGALRLSMSFFNNEDDIGKAIHAIRHDMG